MDESGDVPRREPETLADLVALAKERNGVPWNTNLQEIAKAAGYTINHTTLGKMERGLYHNLPELKTQEALAYLSGVATTRVAEIAGDLVRAQARVPFTDGLPPQVDILDIDDRRVAQHVLRHMVQERLEVISLKQEVARLTAEVTALREAAGTTGHASDQQGHPNGDVAYLPDDAPSVTSGDEGRPGASSE